MSLQKKKPQDTKRAPIKKVGRRKKGNEIERKRSTDNLRKMSDSDGHGDEDERKFPFSKPVEFPRKVEPTPEQKVVFEKFVNSIVKTGVEGLLAQYQSVRAYIPPNMKRDAFDANPSKNRYKDVVCNGETRVVLKDGREGDYIHANFVKGLLKPFYLTQGPTPTTTLDFWRMILQENIKIICMLCETMEYGREKCHQYWPATDNVVLEFGGISIRNLRLEKEFENGMNRSLLEIDSEGIKSYVWHLHCKSWPDKTVPLSNMSILRVLHYLRAIPGPVVVHCSAGIGRTGTLVAVEVALQTLYNGYELDLYKCCCSIRNYRMSSVQVDVQYLAIAEIVADFGLRSGFISDNDLKDNYELLKLNIASYVQTKGPEAAPVLNKPLFEPEPAPPKNRDNDEMHIKNDNERTVDKTFEKNTNTNDDEESLKKPKKETNNAPAAQPGANLARPTKPAPNNVAPPQAPQLKASADAIGIPPGPSPAVTQYVQLNALKPKASSGQKQQPSATPPGPPKACPPQTNQQPKIVPPRPVLPPSH
ncbi:unnamed protein product [Caenorhabditis auriculariae]|uniref:Uncharacterized protein n=1 Tax=Caenorhabditis auriculariae TaxID=2777116 RepID=A0A8S1HPE9_9PELO|nr:unnamed protein product [Caenorhabditis auriculariae]